MKLLSDEEIKAHQYTITTGNGMPLLPDGRTYVRLEGALKAQAALTAGEKDKEWRIAMEIAHQQDEEHFNGLLKADRARLFEEIEPYLMWDNKLEALKERWLK